MSRVYNFGAGPAMMPEAVVQRLQDAVPNWNGTGMGIAEISHRGGYFLSIADRTESDVRKLLGIGDGYHVLFLNDGASRQFSMVPLNLRRGMESADYIQTGYWSERAIAEARRLLKVRIAGTTEDKGYTRLPEPGELELDPNAAYVHYTANETIGGLEFPYAPETGNVPLVADMSSNFLSKPVNVNGHGIIYASAQKNFGLPAFSIVIVRRDLVGYAQPGTPTLDDYAVHAKEGSKSNTPNTMAWFVAGLIFDWIREQGGLEAMTQRNRVKAETLYGFIDSSRFYKNPFDPRHRSRMNVPFTLTGPDAQRTTLEKMFLSEAEASGLTQLEGHRSVGGMRASIYNAMPQEGVDALVSFMKEFERRHG